MSHYTNAAVGKGILPNAENIYHVDWESLPLTCPMPEMSLWNCHPQVYIPLHEHNEHSCMYCGANYLLKDPVLGEPLPGFANTEIEEQYHRRIDQLRRLQEQSSIPIVRNDVV